MASANGHYVGTTEPGERIGAAATNINANYRTVSAAYGQLTCFDGYSQLSVEQGSPYAISGRYPFVRRIGEDAEPQGWRTKQVSTGAPASGESLSG